MAEGDEPLGGPAETAAAAAADAVADQADAAGEDEQTGDVDEDELGAGDDVDGDPDDDQADDEPEGEHPDETAVREQGDAEAVLKKVSRKADNYIKGLVELLGPELGGYAQCELCDGFPPGLVILEMVDEERRGRVRRQLGIDTLDELEADETHFKRCDVCKGRGRVKTGSLKHGSETADCLACGGHGFNRVGVTTKPAEPQNGPQALTEAPAGEVELPPFDEYGTPSWHEEYGRMPHLRKVPVDHWRVNLNQPA